MPLADDSRAPLLHGRSGLAKPRWFDADKFRQPPRGRRYSLLPSGQALAVRGGLVDVVEEAGRLRRSTGRGAPRCWSWV